MSLWLIGAGTMAQDYAKVLDDLRIDFEVIGRSSDSGAKFEASTGHAVRLGGLSKVLAVSAVAEQAIVAVGIEQLAGVTTELIEAGTRRILVEKPGGLNTKEILELNKIATDNKADVFIAYNRRFYASTTLARQLIFEDGGAISCNFEFTEWSHVIAALPETSSVKSKWFMANSTHLIDLAFHLCGFPEDWKAWHGGALSWHPSSSRFCGSGITTNGVFFSYFADWEAPGRWGIEILTRKRRFVFRPIEQLQTMQLASVKLTSVDLDNQLDMDFKPGLHKQTKAFLDKDDQLMCSIDEQVQNCLVYNKISGYTAQ